MIDGINSCVRVRLPDGKKRSQVNGEIYTLLLLTSLSCNDTTLDFWQGKLGIITRDYDVAVQNNFDTTPIGASVYSSNNGLVGLPTGKGRKTMRA